VWGSGGSLAQAVGRIPEVEATPASGRAPDVEWREVPVHGAASRSRLLAVPYGNLTYKFPGDPWVDVTREVGPVIFRIRLFSHLVLTAYPKPYHSLIAVENSGVLLEAALASCGDAVSTVRITGVGGERGFGVATTVKAGYGTLSTGELRFVPPNSLVGVYHLRNYLPLQPHPAYHDRQQLFRLGGGFSYRVDVFPRPQSPPPPVTAPVPERRPDPGAADRRRTDDGLLDHVRRFARDHPVEFALLAVGTAAVVAAALGPALIATFGGAVEALITAAGPAALAAVAAQVVTESEPGA